MRLILIVVAMAAAMLFDLRASQAVQRPWCAGTNRGGGTFSYNCTIPTFEMCVQGGDRREPRLLQPEPLLPAGAPAAQAQAQRYYY